METRRMRCPVSVLVLAGLVACNDPGDTGAAIIGDVDASPVLVEAAFHTERDTLMNIDSPAIWHGPDGQHWLLVTAKEGNVIRVHDALTGALVRDVGGAGTGMGQMRRPNGVAAIDDLMFVVERDNARIQVFTLPEFRSLGGYGVGELRKPYGISIHRDADGGYVTYITDNYEFEEDVIPADSLLGERVRQYRTVVEQGRMTTELVRTFGDTEGAGVLRKVESILADPELNRLMVAEEIEGASMIKVYDLTGRFTGDTICSAFFPNEAEGIVLYRCGSDAGYWIATDQGKDVNTFHLFDRASLDHLGSFRSPSVLNTDGIALTQQSFGQFTAGAFYAVHDDGNVAGFSWTDLAAAMRLRADCLSQPPR